MSVLLFPRLFLLFRLRRALSFFLGATFFFKASRFRRLLRLFYPLRFLGASQFSSATDFFRRLASRLFRLSRFFLMASTE